MTGSSPWIRAAARLVLVSLAAFIALMTAAMVVYPGGTWLDRGAVGHDFFRNFFCDLTAERALDGQPNPGASLATAGMLVASLGLAPFWWVVAHLFRARARLALAVRALGLTSSLAALAVPLATSQRFGSLHATAIFVAGAPGLLAGILATVGLYSVRHERKLPFLLAALTLGITALDGGLYTAHVITGHGIRSALLPTLQKLAAISLVAWMAATSAAAGLRGGLRGGQRGA